MRIVHFTDIHITENPSLIRWRDMFNKRLLGWANLKFRGRFHHFEKSASITEAFLEDLEQQNADYVLFTGDVTGLSLESEFIRARSIIGDLADRKNTIGLAGNHDVYTYESERRRRYEEHFGVWEHGERSSGTQLHKLSDDCVLICLRDAHARSLLDSSGYIGTEQLGAFSDLLERDDVKRAKKIVALHYGPLRSDGSPDTRLHGLRDSSEFLRIVEKANVDLVVHGHLHKRFVLAATDSRRTTITTPGSLTHSSYDRAYHIYTVDSSGISIEARCLKETTNTFGEWPEAPGSGSILTAG